MKYKNLIVVFLVVFLLSAILLSACSNKGQNFSYNNLTNEQSINEFYELLALHAVPSEDIDSLICFIRAYSMESYALNNLQGDWKKAKTNAYLYDYPEAIDTYEESPFDDLSCREAAYIIYNSFLNMASFSMGNTRMEEDSPFSNLKKDQSYYACYEALFYTFFSEQPVAEAVKSYWKSQGIQFIGSNIHLVSLWGKENGNITNLHCGVLMERESAVYFFEKIDPIMPYQLSILNSIEDMKAYLLNRTEEYEDKTVFVDDEPI